MGALPLVNNYSFKKYVRLSRHRSTVSRSNTPSNASWRELHFCCVEWNCFAACFRNYEQLFLSFDFASGFTLGWLVHLFERTKSD